MPILKKGRENYPLKLTYVIRPMQQVETADGRHYTMQNTVREVMYYNRFARGKSYFYLELASGDNH